MPADLRLVPPDGRDNALLYLEAALRRYRRGGTQKQDAAHIIRAATYLYCEHGTVGEAGAAFAQTIANVADIKWRRDV